MKLWIIHYCCFAHYCKLFHFCCWCMAVCMVFICDKFLYTWFIQAFKENLFFSLSIMKWKQTEYCTVNYYKKIFCLAFPPSSKGLTVTWLWLWKLNKKDWLVLYLFNAVQCYSYTGGVRVVAWIWFTYITFYLLTNHISGLLLIPS